MDAAQYNTELYRLAYQCREQQRAGCKGYCGNCQLNVSLYCNDTREAVLIKTTAAIDNEKMHEYKAQESFNMKFWCIIICILVGFFIYKCSPDKKAMSPVPQETPPNVALAQTQSIRILIERTRTRIRDVNGDGIINCIDYAVVFKELYPTAAIVRNENPRTGFHHLFNAISDGNGNWIYIEPNSSRLRSYLMSEVWGSRYDVRFNVIETYKWEHYCR